MLSTPIDNILVEKAKRQMHLRNGDNKTPEGDYTIEWHNPGGDIMIHGTPNLYPAFLFNFRH